MTAISLGWKCHSAVYGIENGLRTRKNQGYLTCPFDLMITNYPGIIQCFKDGLDDLYNTDYLELRTVDSLWKGETFIYHTKYHFIFNHESPGHGNLYNQEQWDGGINHFVADNFKMFVERYRNRVNNLKYYLQNDVNFIIQRYNTLEEDLYELKNVLIEKYPHINCKFIILDDNKEYEHYAILMNMDVNDNEVKRLL
jgi:hypothetical protein